MSNGQMLAPKTPTDLKHIALFLLALATVVISGVNLALSVSHDQHLTNLKVGLADSSNNTLATDASEYASLLEKKQYHALPFGAAEVEAYYTTIEQPTNLSGPGTITCSALVILDGPKLLMESLERDRFGTPPTVVIGSKDSYWAEINESTENNPVKLLVTLGSTFEGEALGCMSVVFDTFTPVE